MSLRAAEGLVAPAEGMVAAGAALVAAERVTILWDAAANMLADAGRALLQAVGPMCGRKAIEGAKGPRRSPVAPQLSLQSQVAPPRSAREQPQAA